MKVLLVEDHPDMAKISCDLLRRVHGHEVRHVASGAETLAVAQEFAPDIILLDLNLPDMHGYRVAEKLRQEAKFGQTIIVALTGFGITGDPKRSQAVGIDAHFRKPMNFHELASLRRVVPTAADSDGTSAQQDIR